MVKPIEWIGDSVRLLDQRKLPSEVVFLDLGDWREVAQAIKDMTVRGAPAIGVAGAYGVALGALGIKATDKKRFLTELGDVMEGIVGTRPTAVNLSAAVSRMRVVVEGGGDVKAIKAALVAEAKLIHAGEEESTRRLSFLGAELIKDGSVLLTHCNAGPLATAGYGTALGVIIAAKNQGKRVRVFADETRPLLQGARLTAWELLQEDIPVTVITDSMSGSFLKSGEIDCVIVGADRIASNGDVANKIGTYNVAVLAKENKVPFYVAAPLTTVDMSITSGADIPIEERSAEEVTHFGGVMVAPEGVSVANPAFDVTPHRYVTAIITERGIVREPYDLGLKRLFDSM